MADKVVQVPGIGNVAFPDTMSDDQISGAIRKSLATQTPQPQQSDEGFLSGVWKNLNPMGMLRTLAHAKPEALDLLGPAAPVVRTLLPGIIAAHKEQVQKAEDAYQRGSWSEAAGHMLGAVTPLVGPAAAQAGETMGGTEPKYDKFGNIQKPAQAPNIAGGLGEATGLLAPMGAAEGLSRVKIPRTGPAAEQGYSQALRGGYRVDTPPAEVQAMAKTGLENQIPVSPAGAQKLEGLLNDLRQKIDARVNSAAKQGATIDPNAVASRVDEARKRFAEQVNPEDDLKAIDASRKEFLRNQGAKAGTPPQASGVLDASGKPVMTPGTPATPAQPMSAVEAQAKKVGTYQQIKANYGKLSDAAIESQKALARGLREELTNAIPELGALNAKEGALIDLQGALEQAVNKYANSKGTPLKTMLAAVTAKSLTGSPAVGVAVGALKAAVSDPAVRSRLAIAINRAQMKNPSAWGAPNAARAVSRINGYFDALNQYQEPDATASGH